MSGLAAILIFVVGLGLVLCPLARADQSVTLVWNPNPDSSVAGYMIHYGSDTNNFDHQADAGTNTSCSVAGLQSGGSYYFVVSAYDVNHNESPPSSPVEYVMPVATQTVTVVANPAGAGSVIGGGSFVTGSSVTVTAVANRGYTFSNWTENGTVQSRLARLQLFSGRQSQSHRQLRLYRAGFSAPACRCPGSKR